MNEPQRIEVSSSVEEKLQIEQRLHWADHPMHRQALLEHLLADASVDQAVVFAGTQIMLIESPDTALRHLASGSSGGTSQNLPQLLLQLVGTKATGKSKNTNPTERIAPKSVYPQACRTRFHQTCGNENQKNILSNQRNMKPTALRPRAAQE